MALRKLLSRLNTPVAELDRARLRDFCATQPGCSAIAAVEARQEMRVVGEVTSLRIVPRAGSPSLEAVISDGTASLVAAWTGRRQIAGISPGKRVVICGRGLPQGPTRRLLVLNPIYELL
ncbi:MAG: OB-fold nucleic acid binding domain-containing protein [Acidimicrobiales bacterium]